MTPQTSSAQGAQAMGASHTKPTGGYIPGLDGMRAIAFFMVFFAHGAGRWGLYIPATLGVTIFFFLSGYLITTLLRREWEKTGTVSLRDFYIRRTLRIFLPLYVTYALACLAAWIAHEQVGNVRGLLSVVLYFFNYANNLNWNQLVPHGMDVVWSLAVEEHFYLLFPLLFLWMSRRGMSWARQARWLMVFCVADMFWRIVITRHFGLEAEWTYRATDSRFDSILWGSVLALGANPLYVRDRRLLPRRGATALFLLACAGILATMLWANVWYRETVRYTIQSMMLAPIFFFVIAHTHSHLVRWLEWRPVRYLGWLSYALYLSHDVILSLISPHFTHRMAIVAVALACALGYAVALRYTVELPLQRLRARFRHVSEGPTAGPAVAVQATE